MVKNTGPLHTAQQCGRGFKGDAFPPANCLALTQVMAVIETSSSKEARIWHPFDGTGTPLLCLRSMNSTQRTIVAWDTTPPCHQKNAGCHKCFKLPIASHLLMHQLIMPQLLNKWKCRHSGHAQKPTRSPKWWPVWESGGGGDPTLRDPTRSSKQWLWSLVISDDPCICISNVHVPICVQPYVIGEYISELS